MKERIVIIFIAVTLGLLATTIGFFLYESAKPEKGAAQPTPEKSLSTTPQTDSGILLEITEPKDESLTTKRSILVKGRTDPENTLIISSNTDDVVASPTPEGDFTATITIDAGVNTLTTQAITPTGESKKDIRTISFSSEEF